MTASSQRNYGLDLLKIIAMLMVTSLHILGHGGILNALPADSLNYKVIWFIEIACYCAVNCYALASGYVSATNSFKIINLIYLWMQVFVYSAGLTVLFAILFPGSITFSEIKHSLFPVMTGQYWYFTAYFGLFFFMPIINNCLKNINKKTLLKALLGLTFTFSILPTVYNQDIFKTSWGYSVIWLFVLYIFGASARHFNWANKFSSKVFLIGYVSMLILTWLEKCWGTSTRLLNYTSPTILIASIMLLLLFSKLNLHHVIQKLVSKLTPLAFGVYLIHDHRFFRFYIISERFENYATATLPTLLGMFILTLFGIFTFCILVDCIRNKIFSILKIKNHLIALAQYIEKAEI